MMEIWQLNVGIKKIDGILLKTLHVHYIFFLIIWKENAKHYV